MRVNKCDIYSNIFYILCFNTSHLTTHTHTTTNYNTLHRTLNNKTNQQIITQYYTTYMDGITDPQSVRPSVCPTVFFLSGILFSNKKDLTSKNTPVTRVIQLHTPPHSTVQKPPYLSVC